MPRTCDICKIEFPNSKPNKAIADAKIRGIGVWGDLCAAHLSHGVPGLINRLDRKEKAKAGA
ncbi:MAG: hypothetical protein AB7L09_01915 [Nitrospira sp.]